MQLLLLHDSANHLGSQIAEHLMSQPDVSDISLQDVIVRRCGGKLCNRAHALSRAWQL